jgi:putative endonuclease
MFLVYILESCVDKSYYIGQTNNLEERIKRHNQSRSVFTKSKRPWKLVYFEKYETRSLAIKREKQIKAWKNRNYIKKLIERPD